MAYAPAAFASSTLILRSKVIIHPAYKVHKNQPTQITFFAGATHLKFNIKMTREQPLEFGYNPAIFNALEYLN